MKRDMDLVRRIVLATEAQPYGKPLRRLEGVPQEEFIANVAWLIEAGLVEGQALAGTGSFAKLAFVSRLTWAGCEFADGLRDDTIWAKAKTSVLKPGASFTFDILKDWLKTELAHGLPTLRGLGQ